MVRKLKLNTTVMGGDLESFKTAFSRSVLGVTYKKYKRKGKAFFNAKIHNEEYTGKAFEYLYLTLREQFEDTLINYNLRVTYTIEWDDNGKILGFKNLSVNMYLPIGNLIIDELELKRKKEVINIDLFYSDFDAGSKNVRSALEKIMNEYGYDKFNMLDHNITDENYKEISETFKVDLVPTIQIDEIKIENPSEKIIRDAILKSLDQIIVPVGTRFISKDGSKEVIIHLSQIL